MNLLDIIELEQDIVTGLNFALQSLSNKEILNSLSLLDKKISENNKIRLLLVLYLSTNITEKKLIKVAQRIGIEKKQINAAIKLKMLCK